MQALWTCIAHLKARKKSNEAVQKLSALRPRRNSVNSADVVANNHRNSILRRKLRDISGSQHGQLAVCGAFSASSTIESRISSNMLGSNSTASAFKAPAAKYESPSLRSTVNLSLPPSVCLCLYLCLSLQVCVSLTQPRCNILRLSTGTTILTLPVE
jgi:hypothetical protein